MIDYSVRVGYNYFRYFEKYATFFFFNLTGSCFFLLLLAEFQLHIFM